MYQLQWTSQNDRIEMIPNVMSLLPISIYGGHKDGVTGIRDIDLLHIETWRSGTFGRAMTNKGTTISNDPHCVHTDTAPLKMEGNNSRPLITINNIPLVSRISQDGGECCWG